MELPHFEIIWTDYMEYRAELRGFELAQVERIVRYSSERYFDTMTGRSIVIGRISRRLVMIPYEVAAQTITPITVHATTRQQISLRIKTGRFINE